MKWKNEYIVSIVCANRQFIICMTIIISEDADAQAILNSMNKMACEHISSQLKQVITSDNFHYQFITTVKQKLITEEEANEIDSKKAYEKLNF